MITVSSKDRNTDLIILFLRLMIGAFLIYHGIEVFFIEKMQGYFSWMPDLKIFSPATVAYIGKSLELITGILLAVGLFVRIASIIIAGLFLFISFKIGEGRIFMEEQHPFMFFLFAVLFFVEGGRRWSLDYYINNLRRDRRP